MLAPMLRQRTLCIGMAATTALQLAVGFLHLPGIPCPMLHLTGVPCPGCGATRACVFMLRGDWRHWLAMHALAPVFLAAAGLFAAGAVVPRRPFARMVGWVDRIERRTALAKWVLVVLFVYWLARLVYAQAEFIHLVRG